MPWSLIVNRSASASRSKPTRVPGGITTFLSMMQRFTRAPALIATPGNTMLSVTCAS